MLVIKIYTTMLICCASPVQLEYEGEPEILMMNQSSSPSMDNLILESTVQAYNYTVIGSQNVCCD